MLYCVSQKEVIKILTPHTVTCPYTLCILIHEARTLVFMIIITDQFPILHKFVNNIKIKLRLFLILLLKHLCKNKINILALLLMLKYKCSEQ